MKKAVMIGAGQIGRGFIGMLVERAGYHVLFADLQEDLLTELKARGQYLVYTVGAAKEQFLVKNISAINVHDPELIEELAQCSLVLSAVGLSAIPAIVPVIAGSIARRNELGLRTCLNVIACENAIRASSILKREVEALLGEDDRKFMDTYVGFPDCAVDRIIPTNTGSSRTDVVVEEYSEWDVEKGGFKGDIPVIDGMTLVENIDAYNERKLFALNGPNAVTAYYGWLKGYETINEAMGDREIHDEVLGMMEECSEMLVRRHGFTRELMDCYIEAVVSRFVNPYVIDKCVRVAREPLRKLSPSDRIAMPLRLLHTYGIPAPHYYKGIALVLLYNNPADEQSCKMQQMISELGLKGALEKISGIEAGSKAAAKIEKEYCSLKEKFPGK